MMKYLSYKPRFNTIGHDLVHSAMLTVLCGFIQFRHYQWSLADTKPKQAVLHETRLIIIYFPCATAHENSFLLCLLII
jgi:hypothetical protein